MAEPHEKQLPGEFRICMAQAQLASSASGLLGSTRKWISRKQTHGSHHQFDPENETAYRAIAITYMQSAQRFASGKLYVTAIDVWGTPTCDACPIRLQLKISA